MSSSLAIFFLLYLSLHACNARRLGSYFLTGKDIVNKVKTHKLEMGPSISKKLQTQELQQVEAHGRKMIGANIMEQTLLSSFLQAKEASAKAISGYGITVFSLVDLQSMEKEEGSKRVKARSMLGNSDVGAEEALDSNEKDNVGDIDEMDYAQPHRKPPIHNEKN